MNDQGIIVHQIWTGVFVWRQWAGFYVGVIVYFVATVNFLNTFFFYWYFCTILELTNNVSNNTYNKNKTSKHNKFN